jgi:hypothetical protein
MIRKVALFTSKDIVVTEDRYEHGIETKLKIKAITDHTISYLKDNKILTWFQSVRVITGPENMQHHKMFMFI